MAITSIALACTKSETEAPTPKNEVTFALKANSQDTKSGLSFNNGSYTTYFQKGDELGVLFELPSAGNLSEDATFTNTENDGEAASFSGTVTLNDGAGIVFYSYYPASSGAKAYSSDGVVTFGLDVPNEQTPIYHSTNGYSFDPKSDILIAQKATCMVVDKEGINEVDMYFKRLTAVLRIALKADEGSDVAGERISSLKIETSNGDIAGRIVYNPETGEYVKTNNRTNSKQIMASFDPDKVAVYIDADGTYAEMNNVFLSVAPVTIASGSTLTFTIETVGLDGKASHRIVKTVSSTPEMVFTSSEPTVITLTVHATEITDISNSGSVSYTLVESANQIADGAEYLFVGKKSNNSGYCTANGYTSSYYTTGTDVTVENKTISIATENVLVFTLETDATSGQYYIKDSDGKYLYWSSGNSVNRADNLTSATKYYLWTIGTDSITNVGDTSRKLVYNSSSPRFACYTSAQAGISLYVDSSTIVELEEAGLAYSVESPIEVVWDNKDSFVKPTLTNPHSLTVTYSSSDPTVATVDENNGDITFIGNGTTTITASSTKTDTYKAGNATYQITVTGAPAAKGTKENPYTIADALAIIEGLEAGAANRTEECYVSGIVSVVSSYNSNYKSLTYNITADGSTESDFITVYSGKGLNGADFSSTKDLSAGDQLVIKGCLMKYNSTPQIYQSSEIVSRVLAPYFRVDLSANTIPYTGGNTITLFVEANVDWTATIDNNASLKIGENTAAATVSGNADTKVTVIIPQNADGATYTISFSTTSDKVTAPKEITIIQYEEPDGDKVWTLVTDASTLAAGDIIVIAAYNVEYKASGVTYYDNKVMGSISNSVGTPIDVTFGTDGDTIDVLPASAKQYTLGGSSNHWTLYNGSKYIAWGDKKIVELNSPDYWKISFSGNNAIITSVSASSYSLQYNPNSGNGRFATYSSSQKPIRIYRYE